MPPEREAAGKAGTAALARPVSCLVEGKTSRASAVPARTGAGSLSSGIGHTVKEAGNAALTPGPSCLAGKGPLTRAHPCLPCTPPVPAPAGLEGRGTQGASSASPVSQLGWATRVSTATGGSDGETRGLPAAGHRVPRFH